MKIIDISGKWSYRTDENDLGIVEKYYSKPINDGDFIIPGSSCSNGIGKKQEYYESFSKEAVRAPREKYEYIAPLWLSREIDIPEDFEGKRVTLFLERVNIASQLWIDGKQVGREIIELSAPHKYDISGIGAGKHTFTLRIDNRNLLNLADMASGYSVDTQGYWNGVIGRTELRCENIFHTDNIQVYPDMTGINVRLAATSDARTPSDRRNAVIELSVTAPDGTELGEKTFERVLYNSRQVEDFRYDIDDPVFWNEFEPALYTLKVRMIAGGTTDEKQVRFGMRTISTKGREILLNGKAIVLRGTIDCAQFPLTGYPPTDKETWLHNMSIIKSYGLNHIRFHAWCPPEAAFEAADELGLYILAEMPLWLNHDVCPLELGDDPIHRHYFHAEAEMISKTYGNHPSFIMFSNGNENMGDFELLEDITIKMKAFDSRRIYTLTSNFDHPVRPCEDYFSAFAAAGHRVRIQDIHDIVAQDTCHDYSEAVKDVPVPIVSFEVGQYCFYPDVDIIEKYTGNMLPVNFDVIKKRMIEKGVYERRYEYIKASGALAQLLYKEDIECAMRTEGFGGFELLSLCDYTGQSTATVGLLDVMYNSKGTVTPEQFRRFCSPVVPLFKAKRIFRKGETITAELALYDHGKEPVENPVFITEVRCGEKLIHHSETGAGRIEIDTADVAAPAILNVSVTVNGNTNSWNIFVYDCSDSEIKVKRIASASEIREIAENGGTAIITAQNLKNPIAGSFVPVFWSPVHFPTPRPCGAIIDWDHKVFNGFPTGKYLDYQWKTPYDGASGADISAFKGLKPMFETVPNFVDNIPSSQLFEVRAGKAKLIFCGFDLSKQDPASLALRASIFNYAASDEFEPKYSADIDTLLNLFE